MLCTTETLQSLWIW